MDRSEGDVNLSPRRQAWIESLEPETRKWLDRDAAVFLHQSLSTPCLDVLETCGGSELTDLDGRSFLDFHGNSLHQVGHGHPAVLAAIRDALETLPFSPRRFTNRPAVELAEELVAIAPGDLNRVLFAPGGTTAVGMALKIARLATGRFKTISMWDSFHGASLDAISVGGEALFRRGIGPLLTGTEHVPPADPYRCLWDDAGHCESCRLKCARYVEYVLEREGDVAAVIAEPMRCTKINPPPAGYWKAIRAACDRHGALLIFDETAICLGRTGRWFACEHEDVVPDLLILGKGLGGGVFPLAAVLAREELNVGGHIALGHYTHEKNPVACAAGLAAIRAIREEGLVERSARLGEWALERLRSMMARHSAIGDVRGRGLAFGAELVSDRETRKPDPDRADAVMYGCLRRGLSFKTSGGNFLTLTPPLNIGEDDLGQALDILEAALGESESGGMGKH
ncbi:MAG: aspartate aminotransferase family protein [Desulfococcaceae bacterium]